jgi:hypothetical protein
LTLSSKRTRAFFLGFVASLLGRVWAADERRRLILEFGATEGMVCSLSNSCRRFGFFYGRSDFAGRSEAEFKAGSRDKRQAFDREHTKQKHHQALAIARASGKQKQDRKREASICELSARQKKKYVHLHY